MSEQWPVRVRFGGLGGQGLVTLGAVLAEAGSLCGMEVAASQSYGSRARGGATRSDVILSREEIDFPHVIESDVLVVLAQEAYTLYAPMVADGGLVLGDAFFVSTEEKQGVRQLSVPGTSIAVDEVGNKVAANFVMFGALVGYTKVVGPEEVEQAIRQIVRDRFHDVNLEAFGLGLTFGDKLRNSEDGPWR